jgi:hypothetical protein
MNYYETETHQCYGCKSLALRIEETEAERDEMLEVLERVKATGVFLGAIPQAMVDAVIAKAKGE